jgi:hypothetical protein
MYRCITVMYMDITVRPFPSHMFVNLHMYMLILYVSCLKGCYFWKISYAAYKSYFEDEFGTARPPQIREQTGESKFPIVLKLTERLCRLVWPISRYYKQSVPKSFG